MKNGSEPGESNHLRWPAIWLAVLVLAALAPIGIAQTPAPPTPQLANTFEEEIANGRDFLKRRRFEDALKSFKRANDLKDKKCAQCFYLMANAYMGLEAYRNVITSCDTVIQWTTSDTELQAQAYNLKGVALQRLADLKEVKKLEEAEASFRQALTVKPDFAEGHYNVGVVLLQQNRDADGIVELKRFIELAPDDGKVADTQKLIENPRRAREPFAPDFSFTTAEGEFVSLDELHGKVVLLDFWGTWCPPCVASLPGLRDLNKKYGKDGSFVMISVSSDGDEEKWKTFVVKEKMVWPQYLDRDRKVERVFGIRAFPTYILLDAEGVIKYRAVGMSLEKEASLEEAIHKQLKLASRTEN
ncbi:MAG TPA: redoxin family protein [Pyrinomonadaceae bacterium]